MVEIPLDVANNCPPDEDDRAIDNLLAEFRIARAITLTRERYTLSPKLALFFCNQNWQAGS